MSDLTLPPSLSLFLSFLLPLSLFLLSSLFILPLTFLSLYLEVVAFLPLSSSPSTLPTSPSIHHCTSHKNTAHVSLNILTQIPTKPRRIPSRSRENGWLSEPPRNPEHLTSDVAGCEFLALSTTHSQRSKTLECSYIILR